MKKAILILLIALAATSCRTRKVATSKTKTESSAVVELNKSTESRQTENLSGSSQNRFEAMSDHRSLELTALVDSMGKVQPAFYEEWRGGELYRKIVTTGTAREVVSKYDTLVQKDTIYIQQSEEYLQAKLDSVAEIKQRVVVKEREVVAKGFQLGVYVLGGLVLVLAAVLGWLTWQMRKLKKGFNMN